MRLKILNYNDDVTGIAHPNISRRVEFFLHYWEFVLLYQKVNFDSDFLKSHRTIINKVRLQVEGNFLHSLKNVRYFFFEDALFKSTDIVLKQIRGTRARKAIQKLRGLAKLSRAGWEPKKRIILNQLTIIESWLNNDYPACLAQIILHILEKDSPLDLIDREKLKALTNCFIIEMYNKGFSAKFIQSIPDSIIDFKSFPYEKISSDFATPEEFEKYKMDTFKTLNLKGQIQSLLTILNRTVKERYLIFRVYDVNWRIPPFTFHDVEFYNPNPGFHPKIVHRQTTHLMEETFTYKPEPYDKSSTCNACIKVDGIQEGQMFSKGFWQVKSVLNILNRELGINGKVYPNNVLITNNKFDQLWGSTDAYSRGFKPLDEIKPQLVERLKYLEKLDITNPNDKKVFELLSNISDVLIDKESFDPEKLWITLEANFGTEIEIKSVFKNVNKIYLRYNFYFQWKNFLSVSLNPRYSFTIPGIDYELSDADANMFGVDNDFSQLGIKKFLKNMPALKTKTNTPFLFDILEKIEKFQSDPKAFYDESNKWIDYLLTELYTERNLTFHSNMSDTLFLLKQRELLFMMNNFLEFFLYRYLKHGKRRSILRTVKSIEKTATKI